jgi:hypothetical protein
MKILYRLGVHATRILLFMEVLVLQGLVPRGHDQFSVAIKADTGYGAAVNSMDRSPPMPPDVASEVDVLVIGAGKIHIHFRPFNVTLLISFRSRRADVRIGSC